MTVILRAAIGMLLVMTIITGFAYPFAITGIVQSVFPAQAGGSLIKHGDAVVGSTLLGQYFGKPEYFHPRPSAAGSNGFDATASGGSNLGPTNPALNDRLTKDAAQFRKDNPNFTGTIPADAITTSASGLDPEISPANAIAQAPRVAKARGMSTDTVLALVNKNTQHRDLGFLGEPRVNVLKLNLALDGK